MMLQKSKLAFIFLFITLLFPVISPADIATGNVPYPFNSIKDAERFDAITKEIRCLVCQNQTIADSYAPLAKDLRQKIYDMILADKSDIEIKDYLVKRYGEFILLNPTLTPSTLLLWVFPFLGVGVLLLVIVRKRHVLR